MSDTHKTPSECEAQAHQLSVQQLRPQQSAVPLEPAWAASENHPSVPICLHLLYFNFTKYFGSWLGFLASLISRSWQKAKLGRGFWGLLLQQAVTETSGLPCSLPEEGSTGSLNRARAGVDAGVRPEGWRRWSAHTLGSAVWVFALVPKLPHCPFRQLFWVPYIYIFFVTLLLQERFAQVQALQQRAPDPSLSHFHKVLFYDNLSGTQSHHCLEIEKIFMPTDPQSACFDIVNCSDNRTGRIKTKVHYFSGSLSCNIQIWNSRRKKTKLMFYQPDHLPKCWAIFISWELPSYILDKTAVWANFVARTSFNVVP